MARFLIEIPHEEPTLACARIVQAFLTSGSHLLTNADWGCMDGVHTAWIVVDADSKADARFMIPSAFRADAKIIALNKFTLQAVEEVLKKHAARVGRVIEEVGPLRADRGPHALCYSPVTTLGGIIGSCEFIQTY